MTVKQNQPRPIASKVLKQFIRILEKRLIIIPHFYDNTEKFSFIYDCEILQHFLLGFIAA